jgi:hypothetical protein
MPAIVAPGLVRSPGWSRGGAARRPSGLTAATEPTVLLKAPAGISNLATITGRQLCVGADGMVTGEEAKSLLALGGRKLRRISRRLEGGACR